MNTKLKPILAALGMGLALTTGSAAAVTWFPPITSFQDDNLDFHYIDVNADGRLDVGDTLVSVFEIDNTFGVFGGGPAPIGPGQELTGVAALDVVAKVANGANFDFVFAPHAAGLDAVLALGGFGADYLPGTLGDAGNGAIAAAWLDSTPNLTVSPPNCTGLGDCIAKAGDGALWEVDGILGDPDEFWVAINARDLLSDANASAADGSVDDLASSTTVAFVNYALSIMYNGTGVTLLPKPCFGACNPAGNDTIGDVAGALGGMTGSGNVLGGVGLTNGAFGRSDFDFEKAVPEPATLALLGMGLLGMGASLRKKVR